MKLGDGITMGIIVVDYNLKNSGTKKPATMPAFLSTVSSLKNLLLLHQLE